MTKTHFDNTIFALLLNQRPNARNPKVEYSFLKQNKHQQPRGSFPLSSYFETQAIFSREFLTTSSTAPCGFCY